MYRRSLPGFLLLASLVFVSVARAEPPDDAASPVPGVRLETDVVVDSVAYRAADERSRTVTLGKTSLGLAFDLEAAGLARGMRAYVSVLGTFGDDPSEDVGDIQVVNNIAAGRDLKILEAWIEKSVGDRISVLAGYHDFNTEFDVVENAAELLNSSFGIGPEISQFGPSIFPSTHPGVRLLVQPSERTYMLAAAYDGLKLERAGAATAARLVAVETGWSGAALRGERGKVGVGLWSIEGVGRVDGERMSGIYVLAEQDMTTPGGSTLGFFVRAGRMTEDCHPVRGYLGAGLRMIGPTVARPADVISLGIARADLSPRQQAIADADAETTFELTWVIRIQEWMALQPDLQYVHKPANSKGGDRALVAAVRVVLSF